MYPQRSQMQQRLACLLLLSCMWLAAGSRSSILSKVTAGTTQQLAAYSTCGGKIKCAYSGQQACMDAAYQDIQCPAEYSCQRQDEWYWRCLPNSLLTANATGAELDASAFIYGSRVEPPPPSNAAILEQADSFVPSTSFDDHEYAGYTSDGSKAAKANKIKGRRKDSEGKKTRRGSTKKKKSRKDSTETPAVDGPGVRAPNISPPLTGTNNYYLLTYSADPSLRPLVLETLDGAVALKYEVIRMWAFADGPGWNHLQTSPGVYNSRVLDSLDWLMDEAANRGLQFMMTLTQQWSAYGGIPQYVRWAKGLPPNRQISGAEFYRNDKANTYFRDYAKFIVTRYRSHPAVHLWDLINEPRADGDKTGAIAKWITATAAFVRTYDSEHPLTVGSDGFFGPSTADFVGKNPYPVRSGNDFIAECRPLDFCCFHMYPDHWLPQNMPVVEQITFAERWMSDHVAAVNRYLKGKPVVMSEYNIEPKQRSQEKLAAMVSL